VRDYSRAISRNAVSELRAITIISGGQTGADRAALDFAIKNGIPHGGWCPRGRLAEDGPIDGRYKLQETPSRRYAERTECNVRESDATCVFTISPIPNGGTALTLEIAGRLSKPCLHLARDTGLSIPDCASLFGAFVEQHQVRCLNIAGPRASQEPKIAEFVCEVLTATLHAEANSKGRRTLP
jgi:Circularly permutated YpsA SLOG family